MKKTRKTLASQGLDRLTGASVASLAPLERGYRITSRSDVAVVRYDISRRQPRAFDGGGDGGRGHMRSNARQNAIS